MRSDAVDLHDEASAEYKAAFDWYESSLLILKRVPRPCPSVLWRDRAGILISNSQLHRDPERLSFSSSPLRFNLNHPLNSRNVVTKAAPCPLLRTRHKSPPHRIAMNVSQLLDALSLGPDVEVIVSGLPERTALNLA